LPANKLTPTSTSFPLRKTWSRWRLGRKSILTDTCPCGSAAAIRAGLSAECLPSRRPVRTNNPSNARRNDDDAMEWKGAASPDFRLTAGNLRLPTANRDEPPAAQDKFHGPQGN